MPTHPDIIEFMTLYEQVQSQTNGQSGRIPFLFKNNPKFTKFSTRHANTWIIELAKARRSDPDARQADSL